MSPAGLFSYSGCGKNGWWNGWGHRPRKTFLDIENIIEDPKLVSNLLNLGHSCCKSINHSWSFSLGHEKSGNKSLEASHGLMGVVFHFSHIDQQWKHCILCIFAFNLFSFCSIVKAIPKEHCFTIMALL